MPENNKFNSRLLQITEGDPRQDGTGDISPTAKKTFADYLSRRTKGELEPPESEVVGSGDLYTYTPQTPNAYPIAGEDERQQKFARAYEIARWTHPSDVLGGTLLLKNLDRDTEKKKRYMGSLLRDIIAPGDLVPDVVDTVYSSIAMGKTGDVAGESPPPVATAIRFNPISAAVQAELQVKLSKNRFSSAVDPIIVDNLKSTTGLTGSDLQKQQKMSDISSWVSRTVAYNGSKQLSTSHRNAAELAPFGMTEGFSNARDLYEGTKDSVKTITSKIKNTAKISTLNKEKVKEIEDYLDSQYVPFYIHDLRTNEILNFHAFLENVSDQYSANWKDEDGFGRLDPVQIYKNTTRSIGVEFYVVSTSEKDFDRMWMTINRLVMMVYPQWSEGYSISGSLENGEKYSFTQPFSQVFSASPLVRLRVGDIIASNYSRFNLARNFGMGTLNKFALEGQISEFDSEVETRLSAYSKRLDTLTKDDDNQDYSIGGLFVEKLLTAKNKTETIPVIFSNTITLKQGEGFYSTQAGFSKSITILRGATGNVKAGRKKKDGTKLFLVELDQKNRPVFNNFLTSLGSNENTTAEIKEVVVTEDVLYCIINNNDTFENEKNENREQLLAQRKKLEEQGLRKANSINDLNFNSDKAMLGEEFAKREEAKKTAEVSAIEQQISAINDSIAKNDEDFNKKEIIHKEFGTPGKYFSPNESTNSIVRSFEDSQGRGVAGSIRSLSFDWNQAPWETSAGSKAPMWCKVSLQFNPIHDIPMGLDHEGMPRAVPYPVGEIVRETYFPELHNSTKDNMIGQAFEDSTFGNKAREFLGDELDKYKKRNMRRLF